MTVPWLENPKVCPEPPHNHHSAHDCDDQLPIFSRVGRGPSGDSLSARFETDENGYTYLVVVTTKGDGTVSEERRRIDGGKLQCYYALQNNSVPATFTLTFVYDGVTPETSWSFTTPAIPYLQGEYDWDDSGISGAISLYDLARILGIDPLQLKHLIETKSLPVDLLPNGKDLKQYIDDAFDNVGDTLTSLQSQIDGLEVGIPELPLSVSNGGTGTTGSNFDGNLLLIYDPTDDRLEELSVADAKTLLGIQDGPDFEHLEICPPASEGIRRVQDHGRIHFFRFGQIAMVLCHSMVFQIQTTPITINPGGQWVLLSEDLFPTAFYPVRHIAETTDEGTTLGSVWGVCRVDKIDGNTHTYFPDLAFHIEGTPSTRVSPIKAKLSLENTGNSPITLSASNDIVYSLHGSITYLLNQG